MHLKTGDILLVHTKWKWYKPLSYIGALIRIFTKSYFNHAAIIIVQYGEVYVVESDIKGVVILPLSAWKKDQTVKVYRIAEPYEVNEVSFITKALSKTGVAKYDFLSLLWFQLVYQLTGRYYGFTNTRKAEKRFYCSEFVAWMLNINTWYKLTPSDLYKMLEQTNDPELYVETSFTL